jgi:chorismate mutase
MSAREEQNMNEEAKSDFYLIRKRAVPETLLKVVEVNRLLSTGKVKTIQDAVDLVGISRSSYYKFKDDITEFHNSMVGMTLTVSMEISDETGILSDVLRDIAEFGANILTIHQSIPIGGLASVSISMQVLQSSEDVSVLLSRLEALRGVHKLKVSGLT